MPGVTAAFKCGITSEVSVIDNVTIAMVGIKSKCIMSQQHIYALKGILEMLLCKSNDLQIL